MTDSRDISPELQKEIDNLRASELGWAIFTDEELISELQKIKAGKLRQETAISEETTRKVNDNNSFLITVNYDLLIP